MPDPLRQRTVSLFLSVQPMPSGKWVGTVRRDEFGLQRPHDTRGQAIGWVLERAGEELRDEGTDSGAAA